MINMKMMKTNMKTMKTTYLMASMGGCITTVNLIGNGFAKTVTCAIILNAE